MLPYFHQWQSSSRLPYKATTPHNSSICSDKGLKLPTSTFTVTIHPLSTRLIKTNFCFTTVSLEPRNPFTTSDSWRVLKHHETEFIPNTLQRPFFSLNYKEYTTIKNCNFYMEVFQVWLIYYWS